VDALLTGELSHHEVLDAVENGRTVFLCGHTNTERGFLSVVMRRELQQNIDGDIGPGKIEVIVSKKDKDPVEII
jgi:putative NIF3 family GTP cyclohydrolase 1 type 2